MKGVGPNKARNRQGKTIKINKSDRLTLMMDREEKQKYIKHAMIEAEKPRPRQVTEQDTEELAQHRPKIERRKRLQ